MNKIPIQAWSKLAHVSIGRVDAKLSFKYTSQGAKMHVLGASTPKCFQKIDAIPNLTSSPIFHLVVVAVIVVDDVAIVVVVDVAVVVVVVFTDISH